MGDVLKFTSQQQGAAIDTNRVEGVEDPLDISWAADLVEAQNAEDFRMAEREWQAVAKRRQFNLVRETR